MVIRICMIIFFFSFFNCFSAVVFSSPYNVKAAFLSDKSRNGKYQLCIYIPASVKCMTNHVQGVTRYWKLYAPYLAYEIMDEGKAMIYFLNIRTGIAAKKATISGRIKNLWVSPGGDRVLSIEEAPFGNLLINQGIYLDNSYHIIKKVSSSISIVGWTFPADIVYLKDSNMKSVIALSLDNGKNKETLHSFDENEDIIDVSISSQSTAFAVSLKRDNKYSIELVTEGVRKVVANSLFLFSPYISDDGHKIVYIEKQSDRKNVINIYNNETKNTMEYFVVDYKINNLILLSGY